MAPSSDRQFFLQVPHDQRDRFQALHDALTQHFETVPRVLKARLGQILFSAHSYDAALGVSCSQGEVMGSTFVERGEVVLWRSANQSWMDYIIHQLVLDHELGHLVQDIPGELPDHISQPWEHARHADTHHHRAAPHRRSWLRRAPKPHAPKPHDELLIAEWDGLSRRFLPASGWTTCYAQATGSICEDWAEAVAFYLCDLRNGYLWNDNNKKIRFVDLFPHRSAFLREYFATAACSTRNDADMVSL